MPSVTIAQICDAIESTLSTASGINTTQSYDELGEGLNAADLPLIQVYWEDLSMDPTGATDRTTFGAGVRQKQITVHADVYAAQRSFLWEDMQKTVDAMDNVLAVLEVQNTVPYFGEDGIRSWQLVSALRGTFPYSQAQYMGARFILTVWVY
jgi:hypothetical protein